MSIAGRPVGDFQGSCSPPMSSTLDPTVGATSPVADILFVGARHESEPTATRARGLHFNSLCLRGRGPLFFRAHAARIAESPDSRLSAMRPFLHGNAPNRGTEGDAAIFGCSSCTVAASDRRARAVAAALPTIPVAGVTRVAGAIGEREPGPVRRRALPGPGCAIANPRIGHPRLVAIRALEQPVSFTNRRYDARPLWGPIAWLDHLALRVLHRRIGRGITDARTSRSPGRGAATRTRGVATIVSAAAAGARCDDSRQDCRSLTTSQRYCSDASVYARSEPRLGSVRASDAQTFPVRGDFHAATGTNISKEWTPAAVSELYRLFPSLLQMVSQLPAGEQFHQP